MSAAPHRAVPETFALTPVHLLGSRCYMNSSSNVNILLTLGAVPAPDALYPVGGIFAIFMPQ